MARFQKPTPWRFILTTLDGETVTSLENLAANRTITFRLNQPAMTTGRVPSDDPRVNITDVEPGLDAPHLSFADRLMYGFRRETVDPDSWVVRFAGIVTQIEDQAGTEQPYSTYTAYDPWQYLFHLPLLDGTGLIPADGLAFNDRGDVIVFDILAGLEGPILDGGAAIRLGTFEETPTININFQRGTSVGDALRQLVAVGGMDIVFTPVYDAALLNGICCEVTVYRQAGTVQDAAVFSWDVGRAVTGITSLLDGDQMANVVQFYNGQGGDPVLPAEDAASQARYGLYETQQFFPSQTGPNGVGWVEGFAELQLALRKQGRRSVTISPSPTNAPRPFLNYNLGDKVPVYATRRLRQTIPWATEPAVYQRIYGIPITLGDDGIETVSSLVASPDGFT